MSTFESTHCPYPKPPPPPIIPKTKWWQEECAQQRDTTRISPWEGASEHARASQDGHGYWWVKMPPRPGPEFWPMWVNMQENNIGWPETCVVSKPPPGGKLPPPEKYRSMKPPQLAPPPPPQSSKKPPPQLPPPPPPQSSKKLDEELDGPAEQTIQLAQQRSSAGLNPNALVFIPSAALPSGTVDNMVDGQQQRGEAVDGLHDGGA